MRPSSVPNAMASDSRQQQHDDRLGHSDAQTFAGADHVDGRDRDRSTARSQQPRIDVHRAAICQSVRKIASESEVE